MESSKIENEKLQMFFDGELPPEEEAAVRRKLESSPAEAAQVAEWDELRAAMQSASAEWTGDIDSNALFARIEQQIRAPEEAPALRVLPGGRERRVWGGMAAGFAAAAAILLAVLAWPGDQSPTEMAGVTRGSEVLEVDFGEYAGTVFMVKGNAGQSLSVVWINDEEVAIP
jgi:anti-sigma factor RsiW